MTNGWHPRKIMVCLDSRQKTHIAQVFTAARMTWPDLLEGVELIPVLNGFIKLKDGAMSTRKGTIIRLQDLLDEAFVRTKAIITEKGQALSDDDISAIAIGAVKYSYLAQDRENDVIFDWDKALSFEGNSGPYIQYALVRARNILEKAGNLTGALSTEDFTSYDAACLRRVMFFDRIVQETATKCKPHVLALYLYELASDFNAFYVHTPKILEEKNEALKHARIRLVSLVCETLQK
jgi:arginyl-tRNA synthetase